MLVATHPSDLEMFQALKARQASALGQLYDSYGDMMYALAFRILRNSQEAEDLIQEIFEALWQNCSYSPQRGSLKSFLMLLVRSRSLDRLRSQKSTQNALERAGHSEVDRSLDKPLETVVSDEISQRVRAALAELPENQRQAFEMAYFEGLSQREISQSLEVPVGTVKSWFRLGFTKLRRSLNDLMS